MINTTSKILEYIRKNNQVTGSELADVLFVVICLANQTGVDLTEVLQKNIDKKTERDSDRHKNNEKLKNN